MRWSKLDLLTKVCGRNVFVAGMNISMKMNQIQISLGVPKSSTYSVNVDIRSQIRRKTDV